MMNLEKPILENQKHSGISAWLMAFAYICGLIAQKTSVNQSAEFSSDSPVLGLLLKGKTISQSALDDTKVAHPLGKKLPFLCWLFDYSDKTHVWCMNLLAFLA